MNEILSEQKLAEIEAMLKPAGRTLEAWLTMAIADIPAACIDLLAEVRRLNALVEELTGYNQRVSANSTGWWQETCLLKSENERLQKENKRLDRMIEEMSGEVR